MNFRKKLKIILLLIVISLVTFFSFSLYNAPFKVVRNYINHDHFSTNEIINSAIINQFLDFNKEKNLPEPAINLKIVNRSANKSQVIANFEIFTYDTNNNLTHIYAGSLLFSLIHTNWRWEIKSIDVIKDIGK
ncbi:hypothetical protein A8L34_18870 [Bacillus sp. FJAT-27264]|uniref:hypothetical protein n=1 Tax=Paenibacillus sp. (strain DSM 101736 / FJAT-27264) TaxID=1850362 RepID=UPI000807D54F|nr:hypothetical protein [Bacillus sp. FJAT-27264]OBZ10645.1 hypothetical protein A8L34_18870 [Bacillus sp. FJAT-27264]